MVQFAVWLSIKAPALSSVMSRLCINLYKLLAVHEVSMHFLRYSVLFSVQPQEAIQE